MGSVSIYFISNEISVRRLLWQQIQAANSQTMRPSEPMDSLHTVSTLICKKMPKLQLPRKNGTNDVLVLPIKINQIAFNLH